jgi:glycosyltransferase involved in cell wall biosynthesis
VAWSAADRDGARAELGIPSDARVIGWHGRVEIDHKGLDLLLESVQMLDARRVVLLLVGGGTDVERLRRLIREAKLDVRFVAEFVRDRARLARYLSACDLYALPSRREGFPVAPVEAMACGLPVVAADVPGIAEILAGREEGGVVVAREDARSFAEGLARLLDDDALRAALATQARRRAESAFSLDAVGRQLRAFLFPDPALPYES